jgi:preprotein translocase subunit SecE
VSVKKDNFIVRYFKETRAELKKVTWPTRQEALNLTLIVVGFTISMAALLGLIDYIFAWVLGLIIR